VERERKKRTDFVNEHRLNAVPPCEEGVEREREERTRGGGTRKGRTGEKGERRRRAEKRDERRADGEAKHAREKVGIERGMQRKGGGRRRRGGGRERREGERENTVEREKNDTKRGGKEENAKRPTDREAVRENQQPTAGKAGETKECTQKQITRHRSADGSHHTQHNTFHPSGIRLAQKRPTTNDERRTTNDERETTNDGGPNTHTHTNTRPHNRGPPRHTHSATSIGTDRYIGHKRWVSSMT
jgi:hypothetical protein